MRVRRKSPSVKDSRWPIYVAATVLVLLLAAFAYNKSRANTVAQGVSVGGVDISGLDETRARVKLSRELEEPLLDPIKVSYDGKVKRLTAAKAKLNVDIDGMVDEALDRGNSGFFVLAATKNLIGADRNVSIPARIDYSRKAVKDFVNDVADEYNQEAKDAKVTYTAKGLGEVDGQEGVKVRTTLLRREIVATFSDGDASRRIKVPVRKKKPKVTRDELADKYPTVLIVDRSGFKLRLYKKLKLAKTYGIAVGQVGLETPAGLYTINSKQVNPAWHVPDSDWAGDLAGKVIPGGAPNNPLIARWMGIYDGVGIHGTSSTGSIGSAASHGCIRMIPKDVIELYDRVPMGTPVYIA